MLEALWSFINQNPGFTVIGVVTLIQISPIRIDPWTWLAKLAHRLILGGIDDKLATIDKKIDRVESTIEEREAVLARTHILRFNDELYNNIKHSKEYFDQQLEDIDRYEQYCDKHPDFKNSRTVMASKNIKDTYNRLLDGHKFL